MLDATTCSKMSSENIFEKDAGRSHTKLFTHMFYVIAFMEV